MCRAYATMNLLAWRGAAAGLAACELRLCKHAQVAGSSMLGRGSTTDAPLEHHVIKVTNMDIWIDPLAEPFAPTVRMDHAKPFAR
jgi:hypothetical protein